MGFVGLSLPTLPLEGTDLVILECFQVYKAKLVLWSSKLVKLHGLPPKPNLLSLSTSGGVQPPVTTVEHLLTDRKKPPQPQLNQTPLLQTLRLSGQHLYLTPVNWPLTGSKWKGQKPQFRPQFMTDSTSISCLL